MPKTFNGITIQVESFYAGESQIFMPKIFNGITIPVEWLYAEDIQRHNYPS
jgi:hypothetical protein